MLGFGTTKDTSSGDGRENEEPRASVNDGGAGASESGPGATRTRDLLLGLISRAGAAEKVGDFWSLPLWPWAAHCLIRKDIVGVRSGASSVRSSPCIR
jgi:hypothetical protein